MKLLLTFLMALVAMPALGAVYRCPQADGMTRYQQKPCVDGKEISIKKGPERTEPPPSPSRPKPLQQQDKATDDVPTDIPDLNLSRRWDRLPFQPKKCTSLETAIPQSTLADTRGYAAPHLIRFQYVVSLRRMELLSQRHQGRRFF
ncbi:MAG: hypothetical protein CSA09_04385 [Candidatus Contendobacter odensis]|uniref:DUF4124 domain-containing protein n=1 Tax=Candidatus Contendibacter odensensis TaxID=1400860 RepID=A0A2G6PEE0_9GAMM|nr:MAG: hypothetical protein CSA09_04385 [Candidatus Contendobacter odensis]